MADPYIGEIKMFAGNFAPKGYAFCNGQLMSIAQYSAIFSLLGTTYGGNGQTTFALPNLQGRVPVHQGTGPGLSPVALGEIGGTQSVTLTQAQLPAHLHTATFAGTLTPPTPVVPCASADATLSDPNGNVLAQISAGRGAYTNLYAPPSAATPGASLGGITLTGGAIAGSVTVGLAGSSQPLPTLPPYLGVSFIIALEGIFPSRN